MDHAWFPAFANYRRDGYDFDARWDEELYSFEVKKKAGFGKEGEKNFEGTIADLQMQGYLVVRDLRKKKRKKDGAADSKSNEMILPNKHN